MATEAPQWVYGTKSSFAAGELTPTIEGRVDLPLYQSGAKKIINWMILPSGGLTRRPGTEFVWGMFPGSGEREQETDLSPRKGETSDQKKSLLLLEGPVLFDYSLLDREDLRYQELQGGSSHEEKKGNK